MILIQSFIEFEHVMLLFTTINLLFIGCFKKTCMFVQIDQFSERIWAFMRIKKLLGDLKAMVGDSAEKDKTTAEALELSLKYDIINHI